MRFLGPRSIASLLKAAIDVVYYGLLALIIGTLVAIVCLIIVPNLSAQVVSRLPVGSDVGTAQLALMLIAFCVSLAGYMLITRWTRAVFTTLALGDAFHPDNTQRLRLIGFGMGGVELFNYLMRAAAEQLLGLHFEPAYGLRAVTTWFAVLLIFVLAEVFKEGARLRREADLTV